MTAAELKSILHKLNLSLYEAGLALGYQGSRQTIKNNMYRYANGDRPIPPWIGRLLAMYSRHGVPKGWIEKP